MLYMVIANFKTDNIKEGAAARIYRRFEEQGRMNPEGLEYIDGWVDAEVSGCFQLMECEDAGLLETWTEKWSDLIDFEVVPVISSAEARQKTLGGGSRPDH